MQVFGRFQASGACQPTPNSPVIIATDGGFKNAIHSSAYIGTDGVWGIRAARYPKYDDVCKGACSESSELRAIWIALRMRHLTEPITVRTDSMRSAHWIELWKTGNQTLPRWYDLREHSGSRLPSILALQRRIAEHRELITIEHVPGHSGDILNEAADGLAGIGINCIERVYDKEEAKKRCGGLATSFLVSYEEALQV